MHVHCVCGGSESEYTSGWKDFNLGPRLERGDNKFSTLFKGGTEKKFRENRYFFNICFQFQEPPLPGGNK